jgi:hypothetical protein
MGNHDVTGKWAMGRFCGKAIYAKPPSRKGAEKEEKMNMTENEIAKIVMDAVYRIHEHFGPGSHERV